MMPDLWEHRLLEFAVALAACWRTIAIAAISVIVYLAKILHFEVVLPLPNLRQLFIRALSDVILSLTLHPHCPLRRLSKSSTLPTA